MVHCTVMLAFDNYVDESEISLLKAQTWLKWYNTVYQIKGGGAHFF